jgi:hypothetical protein
LNRKISQGAHGTPRRSAIAATDDGVSLGLQRLFDFYCETAAVGTNNLKIDIITHAKAPVLKKTLLLPKIIFGCGQCLKRVLRSNDNQVNFILDAWALIIGSRGVRIRSSGS